MSKNYSYLDHPSFRSRCQTSFGQRFDQLEIFVEGIHCANCMFRIEKLKERFSEVLDLRVDMGTHKAHLSLQPSGKFAPIVQAIADLGFVPHPLEPSRSSSLEPEMTTKKELRQLLMKVGVAGAVTANIMLLTIAIYAGAEPELSKVFHIISAIIFLPVLFYSAQPFFKNTWNSLKNRRPSIDLPIALALMIGGGLSLWHTLKGQGDIYFDSLSSLVFLLLGSRYLLARTHQKYLSPRFWQPFLDQTHVLRKKKSSSPDSGVHQSTSEEWENVSTEDIEVGDRVRVHWGEKIPVDGKLLEERAYVDASLLTGESRPQKVLRGEMCFAGTQCATQSLTLITSAKGRDTRAGQILTKMESEFFLRTPLTALADRAAQIFTFVVLAIGSVFFCYYASIDLVTAINRSLALIVLACPCALAFATPLAQSLSLQTAWRRGFLIKQAETLEKLSLVQEIIFDKTGTLTEGEFELLEWIPEKPRDEIRSAIYALEEKSDHPIARAFTHSLYHEKDQWTLPSVSEFTETLGKGVSCRISFPFSSPSRLEIKRSTQAYLVDPMNDKNILTNAVDIIYEGEKVATAIFGDRVRADSLQTLANLKKMNLPFFILTGDRMEPALLTAKKLGVHSDHVRFEQTPEDKCEFVKSRPFAAMVGDGANDAVAMATAHVSLAVKGSMEASLRAADIYLTRGGVEPVIEVISIAKKSMHVIRRNLILSVFYNLVCGALALTGYIHPLAAAILMPINSFIVVTSSIVGTAGFRPGEALLSARTKNERREKTTQFQELTA